MRLKISALTCAALALLLVTPAHGDVETDALWLARLCTHEVNWRGGDARMNDCGGIMQVIRNRARVWGEPTFLDALSRTSPRFFAGSTNRAWARELDAGDTSTPANWPVERWGEFERFSDDFDLVYERSLRFVSGDLAPPCRGRPRNWLSRTHPRDREVAHRHVEVLRVWREVNCGPTVHAFYEHVH